MALTLPGRTVYTSGSDTELDTESTISQDNITPPGKVLEHKYLDRPQNSDLAAVVSITAGRIPSQHESLGTQRRPRCQVTLYVHRMSLERRGGKLGSLCKAHGHDNKIFLPETEPEDLRFYLEFAFGYDVGVPTLPHEPEGKMWILIRQLIFAEEFEDPIHYYDIQAWIAERINDTALARVPRPFRADPAAALQWLPSIESICDVYTRTGRRSPTRKFIALVVAFNIPWNPFSRDMQAFSQSVPADFLLDLIDPLMHARSGVPRGISED